MRSNLVIQKWSFNKDRKWHFLTNASSSRKIDVKSSICDGPLSTTLWQNCVLSMKEWQYLWNEIFLTQILKSNCNAEGKFIIKDCSYLKFLLWSPHSAWMRCFTETSLKLLSDHRRSEAQFLTCMQFLTSMQFLSSHTLVSCMCSLCCQLQIQYDSWILPQAPLLGSPWLGSPMGSPGLPLSHETHPESQTHPASSKRLA